MIPRPARSGEERVANERNDAPARPLRGGQVGEGQLEESFGSLIRRMAVRALRDGELARDVAQEVFLITIRALRQGTIQNEANLGGFVYGTARNVIQARLRREQYEKRHVAPIGDGDPAAPAVHEIERDERIRRLVSLIGALEPIDRAILYDTFVEDLASNDVAARYRMTAGGVRKRKSRALATLRARLGVTSRSGDGGHWKG